MPIELYWNMECKQMFQIETLQPYKKINYFNNAAEGNSVFRCWWENTISSF